MNLLISNSSLTITHYIYPCAIHKTVLIARLFSLCSAAYNPFKLWILQTGNPLTTTPAVITILNGARRTVQGLIEKAIETIHGTVLEPRKWQVSKLETIAVLGNNADREKIKRLQTSNNKWPNEPFLYCWTATRHCGYSRHRQKLFAASH